MSKRSGTFALDCGHHVTGALDSQARHRCPVCKKPDRIVVRMMASKQKPKGEHDA